LKLNKLLLTLIIGMFLISGISALDELQPAKLNENYIIKQTCATCSYVNISVSNMDGFVLNNVVMSNNGSGVWIYNYLPLNVGRYDVIGKGDLSGTDTSFATYFEVTGSGFVNTLGFYILILVLSLGIIIFGIGIADAPITILGSFGLYFVGLWILFNGIDNLKDPTYTWAIGLIVLGLAIYISFKSAYELIAD